MVGPIVDRLEKISLQLLFPSNTGKMISMVAEDDYPARARSAWARRARALRALGLLLADGAPTVGLGKTFWRVGRVPPTKTGVTRKRKIVK